MLPPKGANVWVEFEQGDPGFPVWTGGWWDQGQKVPAAAQAPTGLQNIVLQTAGGNLMLITDAPGENGGVVLRSAQGVGVTVNDTGIYLTNGKAKLTLIGPTVNINDNALTVT